MTRYMIQFVDRTCMIVSQKEGEQVGQALSAGESIVVRGAFIRPHFISIIKPIDKSWFKKDFVEEQERKELAAPDAVQFLPAPSNDNA